MLAPPGSAAWLLLQELRLDWRRRRERRGPGRSLALVITAGVPVFLAVVVGAPLGRYLRHLDNPVTPVSSALAALMLAGAVTLMLSQALAAVVEALYERGDLDLIFSSPFPPQRLVAVRALAIAFSAFSVWGYFSAGPLVAIALTGRLQWLLGIVVLFALALAATGVALLLAMGLLRHLGPRRTRLAAHVLSAVIGALLFLSTQAINILGADRARSVYAIVREAAASPRFRPPPLLDWGLRALMGEPVPFIAMVGLSTAVFVGAVAWVGPRFAAGAASAAGADYGRRRLATRARSFARGAFAGAYRKELRLLLRDPMLVPQVVLRVIYLVPLAFLTARYAAAANDAALAGAIVAMVLMANQVTGSLAWITISAEEAQDLLASSPVRPGLMARAKLAAAATPAAALLAPVLIFLLLKSPMAGAAGAAGCAAALLSAGLVNLRWQRPVPRSDIRNRRNTSWFVTLVELALGLLIAGAAGLLSQGQPAGLLPAGAAAIVLLALSRPQGARMVRSA